MLRVCPNCSQRTIPTRPLLAGNFRCPSCHATVGVSRLVSFLFTLLIFVVTVGTSVAIYSLFGVYAVVVWFMFPIGAIAYLRARFCPLDVRGDGK